MNEPVWEEGGWEPLPSVENDLDADACVIGLGGSGLACVHALLDQGMSVVGVDAGPVAGGAAGRNGGFLLAGLVSGYAFAWIGHFFFEKNRPATFKHPFYSLMGDWVMFKDMLTGKVGFR